MTVTRALAPMRDGRLGLRDRFALGTLLTGARALQALPDGLIYRLAAGVGTLAWLTMPARRALVRDNLARVVCHLDEQGMANAAVRAAARNPRALDRLVRHAFGHWVRAYVESAVAPRYRGEHLARRVEMRTPEGAALALRAPQPGQLGRIFVGFHFGAVELAALYASLVGNVPVSGPMESVDNPVMRSYFLSTRRKLGIDILPLDNIATELRSRIERGEVVALVADRAIRGAGARVQLFGAPARLPIGPAVLAVESGAETYVVGMWRSGWSRWAARVELVHLPGGSSRRDRLRSALEEEARLLEKLVANAPEQWWSLFFPIWEGP